MEGAENGAVTYLLAEGGGGGDHLLGSDLAENGLTKVSGHGLHLGGDGGVIVGEVGVVASGVDDAEVVAGRGHVEGQSLDDGGNGVGEVDGHDTAHGAGHLIHEAAGLAEEPVLGVLGDFGEGDLVHPALIVEVGEDGADHVLEGGGGGQTRALEDGGHGAGVKAAHGVAVVGKALAHARDEGGRGAEPSGIRLIVSCDLHGILAEALAPEADDPVGAGGGHGQDVQADGGGDNTAVVMVGVVARQLTAAGHGKETHLTVGAVHGGEGLAELLGPLSLDGRAALGAEGFKGGVQVACVDGGYEGGQGEEGAIGDFYVVHGVVPFVCGVRGTYCISLL